MEELVDEILDKTGKLKERFDELTKLVSDPSIIADNREWKKLVKERSPLASTRWSPNTSSTVRAVSGAARRPPARTN